MAPVEAPAPLTLYGFWRSSATWRVRIVLNLKGLLYAYRPVNLLAPQGEQHSDAYRALNPMSQVPLLETTEASGRSLRIGQSLAIAQYLEDRFPRPRMLPTDSADRAAVWQLAETINAGIQPFGTSRVLRYVQQQLRGDSDAWARHWLGRGLSALETSVRATAGRFAVGDAVTLADACLVPALYHARRFGVDLGALELLLRIEGECSRLEAFKRAHAHSQPDTPATLRAATDP